MRNRGNASGVSVQAISGTYVVMLGMDADPAARKGLLGFAIRRTDKTEKEQYWLKGMRTFQSVYPDPPEGASVSTHEHPIQDFLWNDFTAKPDHEYEYEIVPVTGQPKNLEYGEPVRVPIKTEREIQGNHSVWFNRGVIGSQAYARKFQNRDPRKLQGKEQRDAYEWLSRGLFEGMRDFIRAAKGKKHGLRAAVYEFSYEPIIAEFRDALKRCGDVKIIYDARIKKEKGRPKSTEAKRVAITRSLLKKYGLAGKAVAKARLATPNAIAHNKFIILLEGGQPVAVWTGSTNFTESGIFGQSNVGHAVRNRSLARAYVAYWERLYKDPEVPKLRGLNNQANPDITGYPPTLGVTPIFSPRLRNAKKKTVLDWYASPAMESAKSLMCFTAAFGVNNVFLTVLGRPRRSRDDLRYLFLDKWGVNANAANSTKAQLGKNSYNVVAVGGFLSGDVLHEYLMDRWREECSNYLSPMVRYTHTKFMLVDPLGEKPLVISGSANFSDASTTTNDENMLVILGDKRVADIYLGEFMRLWQHYRFRSIVNANADEKEFGNGKEYKPNYLCEDSSWLVNFFKQGDIKCKRRETFR
jgi:phosphatidylserine/phosphatidylglycerophosphate/cardiolipin synthase-like enzyme